MSGNPPPLSVYDPFAQSSGASSTVTFATVLTPSGGDDGAQIIAAVAAVNAAGCGTIIFGPGTFTTYTVGTVYSYLGQFVSCNGLRLISYGAKIQIDPARIFVAPLNDMFTFTDCNNVVVDGFDVVGTLTATNINNANVYGPGFVRFLHGNTNVSMPSNSVTGLVEGASFDNNNAGAYDGLAHTRGIHIGLLRATTCIYGVNAQFSGDDMVIDALMTNKVVRSLFIYGSINVYANVHSKDATSDDVKLWGLTGIGLTNIHINYFMGAESIDKKNNGNLVTLDFLGTAAVTHRNISIHFDVTYAGSATNNTGSSWFQINKYNAAGSAFDTTDRGHILDGLTLSGNITNYPNDGGIGGAEIPSPNSKWGPTLDSWYNIRLVNLSLTNAKFVRIGCAALKGPLLVENFRSDQAFSNLIIQRDNYIVSPNVGPPINGQFKIINASYANQYVISNGDLPSGIVYLGADITLGAGSQGQTIVNTGAGGTITATLPAATVGLSYTFIRVAGFPFRAAPQAADQIRGSSAINKYLQIDAQGYKVTLACTSAGFWDTQYFGNVADISFQP